jgi:hypothetical protein
MIDEQPVLGLGNVVPWVIRKGIDRGSACGAQYTGCEKHPRRKLAETLNLKN